MMATDDDEATFSVVLPARERHEYHRAIINDFDSEESDKENATSAAPKTSAVLPREPAAAVDLAALRAATDIEAITAELLAELEPSKESGPKDAPAGLFADDDDDDALLNQVNVAGEDSDGNVYTEVATHPPTSSYYDKNPITSTKKPKKPSNAQPRPKKSAKNDLFELKKETNRLLRERDIGIKYKKSAFTLDAFLKSRVVMAKDSSASFASHVDAPSVALADANDAATESPLIDSSNQETHANMASSEQIPETIAPAAEASADANAALDASQIGSDALPAAEPADTNAETAQDNDNDDDESEDEDEPPLVITEPPSLVEIHTRLVQNCRKSVSRRAAKSASLSASDSQKKVEASNRALVAAAAASLIANASVVANVSAKNKAVGTGSSSAASQVGQDASASSMPSHTNDDDDDDLVDLEIVPIRGPAACVVDLTIPSLSASNSGGNGLGSQPPMMSASRSRRNRDLMKMADRQIRERRRQAMEEQQRLAEEARQRKEAIRTAREAGLHNPIVDDDDDDEDDTKQDGKTNARDCAEDKMEAKDGVDAMQVDDKHSDQEQPTAESMDRDDPTTRSRKSGVWSDDEDDDDNSDMGAIPCFATDSARHAESGHDGSTGAHDAGRDTPASVMSDSSNGVGLLQMLDMLDSQDSIMGDDNGTNTPVPDADPDMLTTKPVVAPIASRPKPKIVASMSAAKPPLPPNDIRSLLLNRRAPTQKQSNENPSTQTGLSDMSQAKSSEPTLSGLSGAIAFLSGSFADDAVELHENIQSDGGNDASRQVDQDDPQQSASSRHVSDHTPIPNPSGDDKVRDDDDLMALLSGKFQTQDEFADDAEESVDLDDIIKTTKIQMNAIKRRRRIDDSDDDADDEDEGDEEESVSDAEVALQPKPMVVPKLPIPTQIGSGISAVGGAKPAVAPKSNYIEEEAEVEEDEFMHLGGVDGEIDASADHYEKDVLAEQDPEADKNKEAVAELHLKDMLERDQTEFQNLLRDVTSGNLRKRARGRRVDPTGKGLDLIDSDEENEELLRRIREKYMKRKDDNEDESNASSRKKLERLAQDPRTMAFAKCLAADADLGFDAPTNPDGDESNVLAKHPRNDVCLLSSDSEDGSAHLSDSVRIRRVVSLTGGSRKKPLRSNSTLSVESSAASNRSQERFPQDDANEMQPPKPHRRGLRRKDGITIHTELTEDQPSNVDADKHMHVDASNDTRSESGDAVSVAGSNRSFSSDAITDSHMSTSSSLFDRMMARKRHQHELAQETRRLAAAASGVIDASSVSMTITSSSSSSMLLTGSVAMISRHQRTQRLISKRSLSEAVMEPGQSNTVSVMSGMGQRNNAFQVGVRVSSSVSNDTKSVSKTSSFSASVTTTNTSSSLSVRGKHASPNSSAKAKLGRLLLSRRKTESHND